MLLIFTYIIINYSGESYQYNAKNNIRNLNTSLLNNVYIPEEKEENIVEKESNKTENSLKIEKKDNNILFK